VEAFPVDCRYHVSTRVSLRGSLTLPAEKGQAGKTLSLSGTSAIDYDERLLDSGKNGEGQKTVRIYRRIDFQRKVGDQPQESTIRPAVRRLVILRQKNVEVPFSPDGPLTWEEIDLVRTDVFTPALVGLLPDKAVRAGDRWTAAISAVQELTDLERVDDGKVDCRLEEITTIAKRRYAKIGFGGTVSGLNEDGPIRKQLDAYLLFDLESQHVAYLSLKGTTTPLDKDGKPLGRIEGQFVLTRQPHIRAADLDKEAFKGVSLEPSADNTLLLYDNESLGVRFLYPRRWHVAGVKGRQVAVDEAGGSGLLLTLEPAATTPTGAQFLTESRAFLEKERVRIVHIDQPRRVETPGTAMEQFAIEIDAMGQRALMDYYVSRQQAGGATLAARLLPNDLAALKSEVDRLARSLVLSRPK
jgi:hypothetical protein